MERPRRTPRRVHWKPTDGSAADRGEDVGVGRFDGLRHVVEQPVAEQPVAEQPDPVVDGRGVAVLLTQASTGRQGQQAGVVHAQRGVAQIGLAFGERRPRGGGGTGSTKRAVSQA